jgi:cyclic pyranopterin phosphate synthase
MPEPDPAVTDSFGRTVNYLRVSVTDRCPFRCFYCRPADGVPLCDHGDVLTYEEILAVVEAATDLGVCKVRLTGGEPTSRRDLPVLARGLSSISGIRDLALSTNAVHLADQAEALYRAGVGRVNISLDALDRETFARITRVDALDQVLAGIHKALETGFSPVRINTVVIAGVNDAQIEDLAALAMDRPLEVRFIEYMPLGGHSQWQPKAVITGDQVLGRLERRFGSLAPAKSADPAPGPAERFTLPGAAGRVGVIRSVSGHMCATCNRLRLTADGRIRPCLLSAEEIDIRTPLRAGATRRDLVEILRAAVARKPAKNTLGQGPGRAGNREMSAIGG